MDKQLFGALDPPSLYICTCDSAFVQHQLQCPAEQQRLALFVPGYSICTPRVQYQVAEYIGPKTGSGTQVQTP